MAISLLSQVRLLLTYAQSDSRKVVRLTVLRELHHMASEVPHTWTKEMIEVRHMMWLVHITAQTLFEELTG